jgi:predicted nucleic acid-binding protein
VDEAVSEVWALLISELRAAGHRAPVNGSWIAATAIAHGVPIVTQDSDYDAIPDLDVTRI